MKFERAQIQLAVTRDAFFGEDSFRCSFYVYESTTTPLLEAEIHS